MNAEDDIWKLPEKGNRVAGKVAIITGAGSSAEGIGNGKAMALILALHGAKVALVDWNPDAAEETAKMVRENGGEALVIGADVSKEEDCKRIVDESVAKFGRLDILINNVGTSRIKGDATVLDLDAWDRGMTLNVKSMVMMVKYAVPEMRKCGGGSIINTGSITALHGGHPNLFYPTSKAAVLHLSKTMAGQYGLDNIRVNCIMPGFVYTPVVYGPGLPEGVREQRREAGALKTEGTGWDVAWGALYLASDESRWVTAQGLAIDAGASTVSPHFQSSAKRLT